MKRSDPVADWFQQRQSLLIETPNSVRLPVIEVTDANPPAFKNRRLAEFYLADDLVEGEMSDVTVEIDSWLGCYNVVKKKVTLWRKGIELCCRMIGCEYNTMFDVALVHELGHWFHAEAITQDGSTSTQKRLADATEEYIEAWAQWFVWIYAHETGKKLLLTFNQLEKKQSQVYRAWRVFGEDYSKCHQAKVLRCLDRLRKSDCRLNLGVLKHRDLSQKTLDTFGDILGAI